MTDPSETPHRTYVQHISTGGCFASCMTCGCDPFPNRVNRTLAEADARAHGEFVEDDKYSGPFRKSSR